MMVLVMMALLGLAAALIGKLKPLQWEGPAGGHAAEDSRHLPASPGGSRVDWRGGGSRPSLLDLRERGPGVLPLLPASAPVTRWDTRSTLNHLRQREAALRLELRAVETSVMPLPGEGALHAKVYVEPIGCCLFIIVYDGFWSQLVLSLRIP